MNKKLFCLAFGIFVLVLAGVNASSCPLNSEDYDELISVNQKLVSSSETGSYKFKSNVISLGKVLSGKYSITLVAEDSYSGREHSYQQDENFYVSFIGNGSEIEVSPSSKDLEDNVFYAEFNGKVGELDLSGADSVRIFHSKYSEIPTSSPNSLTAVCVGLNKIDEPEEPKPKESKKKSGKSTLFFLTCEPNWECSGWSECSDGIMKRTCEEVNFCGLEFEYNKPLESSGCSIIEEVQIEKEPINNLWFLVGVIVLILLVIILVNLLNF